MRLPATGEAVAFMQQQGNPGVELIYVPACDYYCNC